MGKCSSFVVLIKEVTVEPVLFLYMLASFLQFPSFQALIYDKICSKYYNSSICEDLKNKNNTSEFKIVEDESSMWIMYNNIAYTLPSILMVMMLLGPWSDRVGRKIPMLLSIVGSMTYSLCNLIVSEFPRASVSYLLIGNIINGMTGGYIAIMMSAYSYIGHISSAKHKTSRVSITESMVFLAGTLGVLFSGVMVDHLHFAELFALISVIQTIALICCVCIVPSLPNAALVREMENDQSFAFYVLNSLKDTLVCVTKLRKKRVRLYLGLQILIIVLLMMCTSGENDILFLYTKLPDFNWSPTTYGFYRAGENFTRGIAVLILLPMLRYLFSVRDTVLALMGLMSKLLGLIVLGLADKSWQIYIVAVIGILQGFPSASLRALMSNMVEQNEQGKLFGLVASAESIASLIATLLFNSMYNSTVSLFQGICFLVAAGFTLIAFIIVGFLHYDIHKSGYQYATFVDENVDENETEEALNVTAVSSQESEHSPINDNADEDDIEEHQNSL